MIEKTFVNEPKYIAKSFTIGCFIHLLLDLPNLPWLYPFKEYDFGYVDDKLNLWWNTLFADPTVSITESIGLIGLIVLAYINKIIFHEKILDINNLKNYLNNQKVSQYRKREKGKNYMKEDQSNQNPHKKRIKR